MSDPKPRDMDLDMAITARGKVGEAVAAVMNARTAIRGTRAAIDAGSTFDEAHESLVRLIHLLGDCYFADATSALVKHPSDKPSIADAKPLVIANCINCRGTGESFSGHVCNICLGSGKQPSQYAENQETNS